MCQSSYWLLFSKQLRSFYCFQMDGIPINVCIRYLTKKKLVSYLYPSSLLSGSQAVTSSFTILSLDVTLCYGTGWVGWW